MKAIITLLLGLSVIAAKSQTTMVPFANMNEDSCYVWPKIVVEKTGLKYSLTSHHEGIIDTISSSFFIPTHKRVYKDKNVKIILKKYYIKVVDKSLNFNIDLYNEKLKDESRISDKDNRSR